ncbi:MAG: ABC transporter permease [Oscillospiraceae bacterium]|nr:ABC transporter permease [Oscillospiraceae bacterium]
MGAIYRREIGAFFTSSIAYIFLAVFWIFSGYFFFSSSLVAATTDMSGMFQSLFLICVILIPVLTMRLFSEEKKQKTEQGLLTAPVSLGEIVFGKYFAAVTLYAIGLCMTFVYALILSSYGVVEWGIVFSNFLALLLVGMAFIAIGVFVSALTENQIAAFILTFVILMALYLIDAAAGYVSNELIANILKAFSFFSKYYEITCGLFNVSTVVFYLSGAFIFNYLTIRVFERRRWS